MTNTVFWDWNGTLLNDVALCSELINTMLTMHGYPPVGGLDAYKKVFCFPIETYYRNAGFDFSRHPYEQLAEKYMELYTPRSLSCPLQPDARAVLGTLQARGVRQVMLSASQRDILAQQVRHFGLEKYFDALVGIDTVYGTSKAGAGLQWLTDSGIAPAAAVMVGDSVHDFEVAQAMGTRCVLFAGGHQPRETLAATGCPVIDRLAQLPELL